MAIIHASNRQVASEWLNRNLQFSKIRFDEFKNRFCIRFAYSIS